MSSVRPDPVGPAGSPVETIERGSWRWYWNRLRTMDTLELPYRAASAVGKLSDAAAARLGATPPAPRLRATPAVAWLGAATRVPEVEAQPYLRHADALLLGRLTRLDGGAVELGAPPDWPAAEAQLARAAHASPAGLDVLRHAMELHRHAHLVRLAQAWQLSGHLPYRQALFEQLDAWFAACPYPQGTAWASGLDAGLRLLNWSIVWQLLGIGPLGEGVPRPLRERWLDSIHLHASFVRHNRSRHSSANNHLIGELVGLAAARCTWPVWIDLIRWGDSARRELTAQALQQNLADGVNGEQASWYQVFVFELLAAHVCIERALGAPVDERVLRRLNAMAVFVAALRDCAGGLSHHGDADHASALPLAAAEACAYDRMLSIALSLGIAGEIAPLVRQVSEVGAWLTGVAPPTNSASSGARHHARAMLPRAFEQGGYYLLGSGFGSPDEVLMTVDAGSLGYLSIAAHGHADALSLRLSVGGEPVLVDRGTFGYNNDPARRRYLRGTSAHNTVCVDATDQSEYGGPFLWLRKARSTVHGFESGDMAGFVDAEHDGYARLGDRVLHRRRVEWHGTARHFEVRDTLTCARAHEVHISWHFAPGSHVALADGAAHVRCGDVALRLRMRPPDAPDTPQAPGASDVADAGRWELHLGDDGALHGWHSPRFGVLVRAPSLLWRCRIEGSRSFTTWIEIETHLDASP